MSTNLDKITIKEYYPKGMVRRDVTKGDKTVYTITKADSKNFKEGLERYVKEAQTLAGIFGVSGVVQVKDFFYANQTAYMVMEYIDGISLSQYLREKGRLEWKETISMFMPVIEALEIIHEKNLVHRDISPDNIMITEDHKLKLIDFGASRSFESNNDNTMTVILKRGYAPIEQYSRNEAQGAYSDIYSLCATIYKLITGETPLEAADRVSGQELKKIAEFGIDMDSQIEQIIYKGMEIYPKDRIQSVKELKLLLQNIFFYNDKRYADKKMVVNQEGIKIICSDCGSENDADSKYCLNCGKRLSFFEEKEIN